MGYKPNKNNRSELYKKSKSINHKAREEDAKGTKMFLTKVGATGNSFLYNLHS